MAPELTSLWQPGAHTLATYGALCPEVQSASVSPVAEIVGYPSLTQMMSAWTTMCSTPPPSTEQAGYVAHARRLVLWMLENLHAVTALTQGTDVQPAELGCTGVDDAGWNWKMLDDRFVFRLLAEKANRLGIFQYRMMLNATQSITIFAPYPFVQTATPKIACYFDDTPVKQRCVILQDLMEHAGPSRTPRRDAPRGEKRRTAQQEQPAPVSSKRRQTLPDAAGVESTGVHTPHAVQGIATMPSVRSRMSVDILLSAPEPATAVQRNTVEAQEIPPPAASMRQYRAILPAPPVSPSTSDMELSMTHRNSRSLIREILLRWSARRQSVPETGAPRSYADLPLGGKIEDLKKAHEDYEAFTRQSCTPRVFYENLRDLCVLAWRNPDHYASLVEVGDLGGRLPRHFFLQFVPGKQVMVMAHMGRARQFVHAHLMYEPTDNAIRAMSTRVTRQIEFHGDL